MGGLQIGQGRFPASKASFTVLNVTLVDGLIFNTFLHVGL
jgi:hypothetical protein